MISDNQHILDFLNYYEGLSAEPNYAVFIRGDWGCGKTYLVKKWCEAQKERKFLYVSLYGVESYSQIEDSFFEQLHPILGSKGMKVTAKILRSAIKAGLKIDINGDSKSDMDISLNLPEIERGKKLSSEGHILIFDDLERCSISVEHVLGYINFFVEHAGAKAIVIGNEKEIENTDRFIQIKEKLLGKAFEVSPDKDMALSSFIRSLEKEPIKAFMADRLEKINRIYANSSCKNLRVLRQTIFDFERFHDVLENEIKENSEAIEDLFELFFIHSIAIKSGMIYPTDLQKITSRNIRRFWDDKNKRETVSPEDKRIDSLLNKHPQWDFQNTIFPADSWIDIIDKSILDKLSINKHIRESHYFSTENTPSWMKVWHYMNLSDEAFAEALNQFEEDIRTTLPKTAGELLHATGIMLRLSEVGLFEKSKPEIIEVTHGIVDKLNGDGSLANGNFDLNYYPDLQSYAGLGYAATDHVEFKDFVRYLKEKVKEAKESSLPAKGVALLDIMKRDPKLFFRMVTISNSEDQVWHDVPILRHIAPADFVATILKLAPEEQRRIGYAIKERYKFVNEQFSRDLLEEKDWLDQVLATLYENAKERQGTASGVRLQAIGDHYFQEALNEVEKGIKSTSPQDS